MAGLGTKEFGLPGKVSNVKVILNGGQRVTFLRPDGYFSLYPFMLTEILPLFESSLWHTGTQFILSASSSSLILRSCS